MTTTQFNDVDESEVYFRYSVTLRISGSEVDFEGITNTLGVEPTHVHKKGDYKKIEGKKCGNPYDADMWSYRVPVDTCKELDEHIQFLWELIKPKKAYLLTLKEVYDFDIFCTYTSDCDHAGFEVSHNSLDIFKELEVPLGVSVVIV